MASAYHRRKAMAAAAKWLIGALKKPNSEE